MIGRLRALLASRPRRDAPPPPPPRDLVYDLYRHLFEPPPPGDRPVTPAPPAPPVAPGCIARAHSLLCRDEG